MIIDRKHKPWFVVFSIVLLLACVWYIAARKDSPYGLTGGSISGLLFGILGTLMMLFAGLLSVRKALPGRRIGTAQFWLRGHFWLGLLSVPFILFHADFQWGGPLETVLLILFAVVVITGIYGIVLQHFLPRFLTVQVPMETFVEQIPYQCRKTQIFADRMIAQQCGRLAVRDDPLYGTFNDVMEHWNAAEDKAERERWMDVVDSPLKTLFRDLARNAKNNWGLRTEFDFPRAIEEIYEVGSSPQAEAQAAPKQAPEKKEPPAEHPALKKAAATAVMEAGDDAKSPPVAKARKPAKKTAPEPPHPKARILKKFYLEMVRPFLSATHRSRLSPIADEFESKRLFSHIQALLPSQFHETLGTLQEYCEQRRQYATQTRLHWWLHSWLLLHVPASIALFVLLIAHVFSALRVVPIGL